MLNAKDIPLNANSGTLPDVSGALLNWLQPMSFLLIVKSIVNFQLEENATQINFRGVWQPFTPQQLKMKPEGQRSWSWFMCHTTIDLQLSTDDCIKYLGTQYRVMDKIDDSKYGYYEYHLILDYSDAGPEVTP